MITKHDFISRGSFFCETYNLPLTQLLSDCDLEDIVKEENGQMRQELERLHNKFLELTERERNASMKVRSWTKWHFHTNHIIPQCYIYTIMWHKMSILALKIMIIFFWHQLSEYEDNQLIKENKFRELQEQVERLTYENEKAREQVGYFGDTTL